MVFCGKHECERELTALDDPAHILLWQEPGRSCCQNMSECSFQGMSVCCCSPQLQSVCGQFRGWKWIKAPFPMKGNRAWLTQIVSYPLTPARTKCEVPVPCSWLELTRLLFPVPRLSQNFKLPHFHPVLTFAVSANEMMLFYCSSLFSVLWNKFLRIILIYFVPLQISEERWRWTLDIYVVDTFDTSSFAAF